MTKIPILSCSAEFYIANQQRNITAYEMVPLAVNYCISNWSGFPLDTLEEKASQAGCEAVTDLCQIDETTNSRVIKAIGLRLKKEADAALNGEKAGEQ